MHIVCSYTSRYFLFYDEYGRVHYDDDDDDYHVWHEHDGRCTSGRLATAN